VAQRRAHARKQLVHAERLRHVIIGPQIEGGNLAGLVAAAREHDDRQAAVQVTDPPQQLQPIDVRQTEIEDDEVGLLGQQSEAFAVDRLGTS
jgi:hypothetical protein